MNPMKPLQGYLAVPSTGTGQGVLVLHAWWGLNDFFRSFCDRLAGEGFLVHAPDMFSGTVFQTIADADHHISEWNEEKEVPPIILPAVEGLNNRQAEKGRGLAIIGFSMGAYWASWLAIKKPELVRSVVLFYGSSGGGDFRGSKSSFLGHFAEKDPYESVERVTEMEKDLKDAGRPVTFYTYPGTSHWFFEKDRPDAYNAPAAQLAWERTLAFLRSIKTKA